MSPGVRTVVISDRPEHPTLAAYAALVRAGGGEVVFVAPDSGAEPPDASVCLLKSRTPQALVIARQAQAVGARVVNDADATAACLDRVTMAERAQAAGLPFPRTYGFARVADVRAPGRLILKQRRSRRGEPVPHCGTADELREAAADWPDEPVVAQEFADGDGWDRKLWVIGDRVFAGLRRSPLHGPDPQGPKHTIPIPAHEIPPVHRELADAVGECFGLDVYGVDLIAAPEGPRIVDVNAFPGFRSIAEAPAALARFTASRLNAP